MSSQERQDAVLIAHCEKKIQLMIEYSAAMTTYYHAVIEMEQGMISGSKELFTERRRSAEKARLECEAVRQELAAHIAADGC